MKNRDKLKTIAKHKSIVKMQTTDAENYEAARSALRVGNTADAIKFQAYAAKQSAATRERGLS